MSSFASRSIRFLLIGQSSKRVQDPLLNYKSTCGTALLGRVVNKPCTEKVQPLPFHHLKLLSYYCFLTTNSLFSYKSETISLKRSLRELYFRFIKPHFSKDSNGRKCGRGAEIPAFCLILMAPRFNNLKFVT